MKKLMLTGLLAAVFSTSAMAWTIEGTGSSFQYPANKAWAKEFYDQTGNKVNYSPTGSGAGIKSVVARQVDFGGSDKPLKPSELHKAKLAQFPIAIGAITFSYNVPGVSNLRLSEKSISGIMLGEITYWDDASLKHDNPGANLPHKKILFVHRSDKSGTTYGFTYYLSKMNKTWHKKFGAKKALDWPMPYTIAGKGNFGVATALKTNPYSIGYVDYADAVKNELNLAVIENKAKKFVKAEPAAFAEGAAYADLDPKKDFYANIQYPDSGYPIMAATFSLVPLENAKKTDVGKFYDFAYKNPEIASKLGYVPIPKSVVAKIKGYWKEKGIH
ncbi:MAG: phosphate ABC transporter substrate-binding protein PstS [Thiotrichales bacterium]|nr:phosphate ABC transporter substrate-binding protein PstS [Thiotrichales bacterium]